ncbi:MAG: transporter substrate-binding domain-containing protein, partial [Acidimicrobiia bacterium]
MKGKHWPRLAVVLIALALVAAACGDSDDTTTTAAAAAATTTTAAAAATTTTEAMAEVPGLVEEGKLIVVTTGNFPPFTLINVDTGANEGYSIDLAQAVADRLGLEAEFPTVDFVAELEGLAQG